VDGTKAQQQKGCVIYNAPFLLFCILNEHYFDALNICST